MSADNARSNLDDKRYSAPEAELYEQQRTGGYGSIESGLSGDYELAIGATLSEAWEASNGNKATILGAALIFFLVALVYLAITAAIAFMLGVEEGAPSFSSALRTCPIDLIYYGVYSVMGVGMYLIGAKISMGLPTSAGVVFRFMNRFVKGLLTYIAMMILIVIGYLLLVLPGIYLSVAYIFAMPLAVEKNLSIWQALETSRKAVTKHWFLVAGLMFVLGLILAVSALALGIGLIWTVPLAVIAYGIAYRNIFGINGDAASS